MRRVCVTMRGTRVGCQCLCVRTGSKPRTSTFIHWRPTFVSRSLRNKVLVRGTFAKRACLDALRQWFMRRACVECSWNTAPYLLDASTCGIFQWFVSYLKRYVRGSCVIRQWFLPPIPRKFDQFLDAQARTNLCVICGWFVSDRLCDWPFMMLDLCIKHWLNWRSLLWVIVWKPVFMIGHGDIDRDHTPI